MMRTKGWLTRLSLAFTMLVALVGWTIQAASATDLGEFNFTTITDGRSISANVGEIVVATSVQGTTSNAVVLPAANAVPSGRRYTIVNAAPSGTIGVSGNGTDTFNGTGQTMASVIAAAGGKATFVSDGVSAWYTIG